jgi:hypothetical protein
MLAKNCRYSKCQLYSIRIRMFLGLPDPHPDLLVTSTDLDPAPDPSLSHKSVERTEIIVAK